MGIVTATALALSVLSTELNDLQLEEGICLAEVVHFESNGEGYAGKKAVANVVINRSYGTDRFPLGICVVLRQPGQFSHVNAGLGLDDVRLTEPGDLESFHETLDLVIRYYQEGLHDNTDGADHFFNPSLAEPEWARNPKSQVSIGNHRFIQVY